MSDYWQVVWGRGLEYGVALRKMTASRLGLADVPLPAETVPAIVRGDRPGSHASLLAYDLWKPTSATPSWGEQWGACVKILTMPFASLKHGAQERINPLINKIEQMRKPLLYVTAIGLSVGVPWCLYRYLTHYTVSEIWDHMVNTDEMLGTGQVIDSTGALVPRPTDDEFNQAVTDYWDRWTWRGELMRFLERIGVSPVLTQRMRRRAERVAARRRTDNQLLRYRDKIMLVRAEVYATLGKESIRDDTPTARLTVARVVEEKMNAMAIDILTREHIREACVNVCFIDTVFDKSGQAILLGPPRRPI